MRLHRKVALLVGGLTVLPWLGIGAVAFLLSRHSGVWLDDGQRNTVVSRAWPGSVFLLLLGVALLSFLLTGFYLFYLDRTDRVPQGKKETWRTLLYFGNLAVMPTFWYLYVRPGGTASGLSETRRKTLDASES